MELTRAMLNIKKLSPKAKLALKMVVLAGAKHKEAAQAVGLHPAYINQLKGSKPGQELVAQMEQQLDETAVETSVLMDRLGREALHRIATLMRHCESPGIQLRAAVDLADRSPQTSKVHKHQVESFTLGSNDAKEIAAALVESATQRQKFIGAVEGEFVKVETGNDGLRRSA